MWRSPNHPTLEVHPAPPPERGQRLASLSRGRGEELRVCLDEYEGHPYVSLRVWSQNQNSGDWWPQSGKGLSIKTRELLDVAEALRAAAEMVEATSMRQ